VEIFFARSWKALALRGLAGVLFGIAAFLWPSMTLGGLVLFFGGYALVDGFLALVAATRQPAREHAWKLVLEALIGIAIGLAAFFWTGMTALVLVDLIALWAIATGVLELALAVRLRREIAGELLLGLSGTASVLLGVLMLVWPRVSAFVIVVLLGAYALFFGATMILFALRLRRITTDVRFLRTRPGHA
jgi:uncharacterized membrane protein HdeD (DUF308 family)